MCIQIINHILKDYVNEQGTKMVLLHLLILVEVLVKANLAYSAIPFSLSGNKLESISTSLNLCLNIFQMVLLHLVVLVEVCAY